MTIGSWCERIPACHQTAVHLTVSIRMLRPWSLGPLHVGAGGLAMRARIVLLAAEGHTNTEIAAGSAAPARPWCAGVAAMAATAWAA